MMQVVITKTTTIAAPYQKVYDFLNDPTTWPLWSPLQILAIAADADGWWTARTPAGKVRLRLRADRELGVVDYEFAFADARWKLPMRLLDAEGQCILVVTVCEPHESLPTQLFDVQVALIHQKIEQLKRIIERG